MLTTARGVVFEPVSTVARPEGAEDRKPGDIEIVQSSFSPFRQGSAFQGTFLVRTLRHVGSFRQADAQAWVTIVDAVGSPVPAGNVTIENLQLSQ
jgi:hypothetical protein